MKKIFDWLRDRLDELVCWTLLFLLSLAGDDEWEE